ncbi:hypothetical protein AVEN_4419-1 [Araneus ventricosus]|uniref:Secreted protein n=1 Tax=Araneus ventricosus TaxID=182803 RepID=A0A4Y2NMI4_ARAVE|nr:hypothetical protein AVEN_4419-1 [Araneus ventricosus]
MSGLWAVASVLPVQYAFWLSSSTLERATQPPYSACGHLPFSPAKKRKRNMRKSCKKSPVPKAHVLGIYCRRNSTSRTAGGRIPTQDAYAITTALRNCTEVSVQSTSFDLRSFTNVSLECCSHRTNPRAIGTG